MQIAAGYHATLACTLSSSLLPLASQSSWVGLKVAAVAAKNKSCINEKLWQAQRSFDALSGSQEYIYIYILYKINTGDISELKAEQHHSITLAQSQLENSLSTSH